MISASIPEKHIKRRWITAGHDQLWGTVGTYSLVDYECLPPVPPLDPRLDWLSEMPPRHYASTLACGDDQFINLLTLDASLQSLGYSLPNHFNTFATRPHLRACVPTCTDCYLELSETVTPLPGYSGSYVVRFMNDSQSCALWYLLFQPSTQVRVLAASYFIEPHIFDTMQYEEDVDKPLLYSSVLDDACICAESFGEFIWRFCVENTIWFAINDRLPLTPNEAAYIQAANKEL